MSNAGFGEFRVLKTEAEGRSRNDKVGKKSKKHRKKDAKKSKKKRRRSSSSSSSSSSGSKSSGSSSTSSGGKKLKKKKKKRCKWVEESSSSSSVDSSEGEVESNSKAPKSEHPRDLPQSAQKFSERQWMMQDDASFSDLLTRTTKDNVALRKEANPPPAKVPIKELNPYWALNKTGLPQEDVEEGRRAEPGHTGNSMQRGEPPQKSRDPQAKGRFEYMGKWQPSTDNMADNRDPRDKKSRKKKETVYFDKEVSNYHVEDIERDKAMEAKQSKLIDYKKMNAQRLKQDCWFCLDSIKADKRLLIALGNRVYLALPARGALCEGHCLIIPMDHRVSARDFDQEELTEVRNFKKSLIRMFDGKGQFPVFMETVMQLHKYHHTYIECVPVRNEDAEIFFYNELDKAESEFKTSSKRVINTKGKSLQTVMPEGFAYFHVEFNLDGGLLHLIEDEKSWNPNFGRDIAGGLLESDVLGHMKRSNANKEVLKVKDFIHAFQKYDWTAALEGGGY